MQEFVKTVFGMDDWYSEFDYLPERDPGEEFMTVMAEPVILNKEVVRTKVDEVEVSEKVVEVLIEAPEESLAILGANEIVRFPQVDRRWYCFQEGVLHTEGGVILSTIKDQLLWARNHNVPLFREMIFKNYLDILSIAQRSKTEEALSWYRMLREVTPALNIISKKFESMSAGLSTLGKIRWQLEGAYERGAPRSVVAFGVGNSNHAMAYHPWIRVCVDTHAEYDFEREDYFRVGNLFNWKDFVKQGDMILSDCALNNSDGTGMQIPDTYYSVYENMANAGFWVLCKIDKLGLPYKKNWRVCDIGYYREHNKEAFVLLSPFRNQDNLQIKDLDIEERMLASNFTRMRKILSREFEMKPAILHVSEGELDKALKMSTKIKDRGKKGLSVIESIFSRFAPLTREWKDLCLDPHVEVENFLEYLKIRVELPCILLDVGYLSRDKMRLMASFHHFCIMEFDPGIGWVAVAMKVNT